MRYIDAQEQEAVEAWLEDAVDRFVRQLFAARFRRPLRRSGRTGWECACTDVSLELLPV
jgi:hypothetical protein